MFCCLLTEMNPYYAVIDEGNSRIKAALFSSKSQDWQWKGASSTFDCGEVYERLSLAKPLAVLRASVRKDKQPLDQWFGTARSFELSSKTKLPFRINYDTPHSLGADRLAGAAGAWARHPDRASLVIDLGTCINFEYLSPDQGYLGGKISPGFAMRFMAMHHGAEKLPIAQMEQQVRRFFPARNTQDALWFGVNQGIEAEIEAASARFIRNYPSGRVFLTGGDAPKFAHLTKNHIFAAPDLTLEGLAALLRLQMV